MTTIAFRAGIMAADSRSTVAGWVNPGTVQKVFRVKDGVAGLTGEPGQAMPLINWLIDPRGEMPKIGSEARVVHALSDGTIEIHEEGGVFRQDAEFMAWGSGSPPALGAMYAGATAAEAVEIAAKLDPATGGPVCVMAVDDTPPSLS